MDSLSVARVFTCFLPLLILLVGWLRHQSARDFSCLFPNQRWSYGDVVLVMALLTAIGVLHLSDRPSGVLRSAGLIFFLAPVVLLIGALFAIVKWKYGLPLSALGFPGRHARYYVAWALTIASSMLCGIAILGSLLGGGISPFGSPGSTELWSSLSQSLWVPPSKLLVSLLTILHITIIAPAFEEIFFRGFVYPPCARRFGYVGAALVTAVIWSLGHADSPRKMIITVFMGLLFARIYRRTQS